MAKGLKCLPKLYSSSASVLFTETPSIYMAYFHIDENASKKFSACND